MVSYTAIIRERPTNHCLKRVPKLYVATTISWPCFCSHPPPPLWALYFQSYSKICFFWPGSHQVPESPNLQLPTYTP